MLVMRRLAIVLVLIFAANFGIWALVNQSVSERAFGGIIRALSYSGYQAFHPDTYLSETEIDQQLATLEGQTFTIRTYGVSDGLDRLPALAAKHGLNTYLGLWLSRDQDANDKEIIKGIEVIQANPTITRIVVGNESLLRGDVGVRELMEAMRRIQATTSRPVSTAEPWHIWLKYPELAEAADFITVHILPYWEGMPADKAIDYVHYRYRQLQMAYPDKHILIGEIGWPSEGQWVKGAEPSLINQAKFVRDFLNLAQEEQIDYSLMESFDQPWKRSIEGSVGAHWGLWDTQGKPKFSMSGSIRESSRWFQGFIIATLLAFLPIQWFVRRQKNMRLAGHIFYAGLIQAVASIFIWAIMAALAEKIISTHMVTWILLLGAQFVLLALLLVDGYELVEVIWSHKRERAFSPHTTWTPPVHAPKVSIHVPCYNEPPHMVIETLNALARLDYPNFEVLVIDNNTKDEAVWRPLEAHCAVLGDRFRFFHLPNWPGYKAGALNFALQHTAVDAVVVGVIDSDYSVTPDWLTATIPYFDKADVAFVQGPQDYRDGDESLFKRMCYWEYAGFFHIGMVQRNERNAIIQHGTMTLIRKDTLRSVGGWAEWCICEDAELGLRLFENGYDSVYMSHSFGRGLIPDSFASYKTQRFRWAYGAVQIIKRHWHELWAGDHLTYGQRYHFISGWLPWFADAAHILFAMAAIIWSILLALKWVEFPPAVFLVPTLSVFMFKVVAGLWLYRARVQCGWRDRLGAAVAGMALSHAVARAVWQGLFTSGKPFFRTPKCADQPAVMQVFLMAREEIILLLTLLSCAIMVLCVFTAANRDAVLWSGMLVVQTLPYWAAMAMAATNALPKQK